MFWKNKPTTPAELLRVAAEVVLEQTPLATVAALDSSLLIRTTPESPEWVWRPDVSRLLTAGLSARELREVLEALYQQALMEYVRTRSAVDAAPPPPIPAAPVRASPPRLFRPPQSGSTRWWQQRPSFHEGFVEADPVAPLPGLVQGGLEVQADELLERGDRFAELVALGARAETMGEPAILEEAARQQAQHLADLQIVPPGRATWRLGYVDALSVDATQLARVLRLPTMQALRDVELDYGGTSHRHRDSRVRQGLEGLPATVERLAEVGLQTLAAPPLQGPELDLDGLLQRLPRLKALVLVQPWILTAVQPHHPGLTSLTISLLLLPPSRLFSLLAGGAFPALERLVLRGDLQLATMAHSDFEGLSSQLAPRLALAMPRLTGVEAPDAPHSEEALRSHFPQLQAATGA